MIINRRRLLVGGIGLVGVAGGSTAAYAAGVEAFALQVTRYRPVPANWPAAHALTIAIIADLHAGGPNMGIAQIRDVVETTQALRADLILVLGDYVATHKFVTEHVPHPVWAAELGRLTAPLGVYAILGNHDWWFEPGAARRALEKANVPVMENDAVLLGPPGRRFWLAGVGDTIAFKLGKGHFRGVDDLPGTLKKITTNDPVILMVHEPDLFTQIPPRVALTLAGHTHGGQVRIPFVWHKYVPSKYGARFAYGHIVEDSRHMIVSGGLGTSAVPARLGVPPEIVHVTLGA